MIHEIFDELKKRKAVKTREQFATRWLLMTAAYLSFERKGDNPLALANLIWALKRSDHNDLADRVSAEFDRVCAAKRTREMTAISNQRLEARARLQRLRDEQYQ